MIELSKIRIDGGTQQREQLNEDVVAEYAEAMKSGAKFPAVTVFYDGAVYWLADGFHRFFAAKSAGLSKIAENVIPGTSRDARLFSFGVNADHGLRRTNADKRKIVLAMLEDTEWSGWSDNAIAKACHVSHTFVSNLRHVTCNVASEKPTEKTYTTKHGTTATMTTANIGKTQPAKKPALAVVPKEPEYNPADDEVAELSEAVRTLAEENDALKDRLACEVMPVSEEEKSAAADTIQSLRAEVKRLEIENAALVSSRDSYQRDNVELKRQCAMYRKQLDKIQRGAA